MPPSRLVLSHLLKTEIRALLLYHAVRRFSTQSEEALNLLRHAPLAQVTVAKEVIRLIGELSSEVAYRELLSWETRELHRDVRVALLRALWDYLEEPETWEIFTRAAQSPDTSTGPWRCAYPG